MKSAILKDAVYVGQGAINDANDSKIVVVWVAVELEQTHPMMMNLINHRQHPPSRSKQTMKLNKVTKVTKANAETLTEEEKRDLCS